MHESSKEHVYFGTAISLLLSGCASGSPEIWVHPDRSAADFESDKVQCYYEAKSKAATTSMSEYRTIVGQEVARGSLTNQLADYCLLAKGYTKAPNDAKGAPAAANTPPAGSSRKYSDENCTALAKFAESAYRNKEQGRAANEVLGVATRTSPDYAALWSKIIDRVYAAPTLEAAQNAVRQDCVSAVR